MKKEEIKEIEVIKDNCMKKTLITFGIGILLGAVIATAVFLIAKPCNDRRTPDFPQYYTTTEKGRPNDKEFSLNKDKKDRQLKEKALDESNKDAVTKEIE